MQELKLPREFLWVDLETMDEFYELHPLNRPFYSCLCLLHREYVIPVIGLDLFNEVYYQATRMVFERPKADSLTLYEIDIDMNLGWGGGSALVLCMSYFLLQEACKKDILRSLPLIDGIRDKYEGHDFWRHFRLRAEFQQAMHTSGVTYSFSPRPIAAKHLSSRSEKWEQLTMNFDTECMTRILNLWSNAEERRIVETLIEKRYKLLVPGGEIQLPREKSVFKRIGEFFDRLVEEDDNQNLPQPMAAAQPAPASDLKKENRRLKTRCRKLEDEAAQQKTAYKDLRDKWMCLKDTNLQLEAKVKELNTTNEDMRARIHGLKEQVQQQEVRLRQQTAQLEQLERAPSEEHFVAQLVKVTKKLFKNERTKADGIRQVMDVLGREHEERELDKWIEGRKPPTTVNTEKMEVGHLTADQVNDIHDNESVKVIK